jgi:xylan 1,4-beta-xylosidase
VLVWNGTVNAALMHGDPRLDRLVRLRVTGLPDADHRVSLARVDATHSNIVAHCPSDVDWPDDALWQRLRALDRLHEEPLPATDIEFPLPLPGVARIRIH